MASQQPSNTQGTIATNPFTSYGNPDVTLSMPFTTMTNGDSFGPTTKIVLVESSPLPSSALQPEANNRYPLLTTDCAPFPYIDPILLMSPTWETAQPNVPHRMLVRLPVVTPKDLSVGLHKVLKKKPGPRPTIYHAPAVQVLAPLPQISVVAGSSSNAAVIPTATVGNMGPPQHTSLKRKRGK